MAEEVSGLKQQLREKEEEIAALKRRLERLEKVLGESFTTTESNSEIVMLSNQICHYFTVVLFWPTR